MKGRTRASKVIRYLTQSNWTHATLYIGRLYDIESKQLREKIRSQYSGNEEDQLIIESELGQGTVIRSLTVYEKENIRICRPKDFNYNDSQKIMFHVISQLGKQYSIRQIFDLMRFLLPYRLMPRKIGSSLFVFHSGSASKTICSSMIAEAFCLVKFPIMPLVKVIDNKNQIKFYHRNPKLCTPKDFDYSPYFRIIKYPFFDSCFIKSYSELPWSDQDNLNKEDGRIFYMTQQQLNDFVKFSEKNIEKEKLYAREGTTNSKIR